MGKAEYSIKSCVWWWYLPFYRLLIDFLFLVLPVIKDGCLIDVTSDGAIHPHNWGSWRYRHTHFKQCFTSTVASQLWVQLFHVICNALPARWYVCWHASTFDSWLAILNEIIKCTNANTGKLRSWLRKDFNPTFGPYRKLFSMLEDRVVEWCNKAKSGMKEENGRIIN